MTDKKRLRVHPDKGRAPLGASDTLGGLFFSFYAGKAPSRLPVALIVPVQPFDDVMTDHTTHDSREKRDHGIPAGELHKLHRHFLI